MVVNPRAYSLFVNSSNDFTNKSMSIISSLHLSPEISFCDSALIIAHAKSLIISSRVILSLSVFLLLLVSIITTFKVKQVVE